MGGSQHHGERHRTWLYQYQQHRSPAQRYRSQRCHSVAHSRRTLGRPRRYRWNRCLPMLACGEIRDGRCAQRRWRLACAVRLRAAVGTQFHNRFVIIVIQAVIAIYVKLRPTYIHIYVTQKRRPNGCPFWVFLRLRKWPVAPLLPS